MFILSIERLIWNEESNLGEFSGPLFLTVISVTQNKYLFLGCLCNIFT